MSNGFFDQHGSWIPQRDPMDGPFMSAKDLTDYSDEPGYAIPPRIVPRYFDEALAAVRAHFSGLDPAATDRKAWGIAQDYESAVLDRRTVAPVDDYVAQLAERAREGK